VALAAGIYAMLVFGVVSLIDWGHDKVPTDDPATFLLRNLYVLAAAVLLVSLPIRPTTRSRPPTTPNPTTPNPEPEQSPHQSPSTAPGPSPAG
jgi:hypothetical protein